MYSNTTMNWLVYKIANNNNNNKTLEFLESRMWTTQTAFDLVYAISEEAQKGYET